VIHPLYCAHGVRRSRSHDQRVGRLRRPPGAAADFVFFGGGALSAAHGSLAGSVRQQPSVPQLPLRHLFPTQGAAGCHFHLTQPVFLNTTLAVDRR